MTASLSTINHDPHRGQLENIMAAALKLVDDRVTCAVPGCGHKSHSLLDHLREAHGLSVADYLAQHPGAATVSQRLLDGVKAKRSGRRRQAAPAIVDLTVDMMGKPVRVNHKIGQGQCLPLPAGYAFPTKGKAKDRSQRVLRALRNRRSVMYWGPPGTGKDAMFHAYSALGRVPALIYTFTSGTDVKRWFYSREIGPNGTSWSYGTLWHALVNGIEAADGSRHPALIVFSDVDRGTPDQLEEFRLLLDTTARRIVGPTGQVHNLFPGTQFGFTANSNGGGSMDGRMSSRAMDASLLDRMGRFVEAEYLHWDDESAILRGKFPTVASAAPELFDALGTCTEAIRAAMSGKSDVELDGEFTHRGLCEVLSECADVLADEDGKVPTNLLKQGFAAWLDRLDPDNRDVALSLIDPHIKGGVMTDADLG